MAIFAKIIHMAGLYIHIPFCAHKCIYCGFYSIANVSRKSEFLQALYEEMQLRHHYLETSSLSTVYIGGGTPSLLSPDELSQLFDHIQHFFVIEPNAEITMEANPEQLTADYCLELKRLGINRLSIGVQSFQDEVLQFMGRRHTAQQAVEAVHNAAAAGFDNLSLDLIYGVGERKPEDWEKDVRTALALPIKHLSAYALTTEENSLLYKKIQKKEHAPVEDDLAVSQIKTLLQIIPEYGFQQYEISNYAIPGFESRHNSAYWHHIPYLGLGPSAHSFNGKSRQWNSPNLNQYLSKISQGIDYEEKETLDNSTLFNEKIMLELRTREGINLTALAELFGNNPVLNLKKYFASEVQDSYYQINNDHIILTDEGKLFADGIAAGGFIEEE